MFGHENSLIQRTLPDDARTILKRCFEYAGDSWESVAFLGNLESRMRQHASNQPTPFGITLTASVSHKALMMIEDLIGHLHEDVLGQMRGNVRAPEPPIILLHTKT
jgi:hypothetical protein